MFLAKLDCVLNEVLNYLLDALFVGDDGQPIVDLNKKFEFDISNFGLWDVDVYDLLNGLNGIETLVVGR